MITDHGCPYFLLSEEHFLSVTLYNSKIEPTNLERKHITLCGYLARGIPKSFASYPPLLTQIYIDRQYQPRR